MQRLKSIHIRLVYFFTPFFTVVYIVERLLLQTIYVLQKEILQFFGPKIGGLQSRAVSNQKWVIMARVGYIVLKLIIFKF